MNTRLPSIAAGAVIVISAVCVGLALAANGEHHSAAAPYPAEAQLTTSPALSPSTPDPSPSASSPDPTDLARMKAAGVDVALANPGDAAQIDMASAVASAHGSFGFLGGAHLVSASLVRLTDHHYGPESENPSGAPTVDPIISNRLVYLLIFDHFTMPLLGGPVNGNASGPPSQMTPENINADRMWIAIDPADGSFIEGRSIIPQS